MCPVGVDASADSQSEGGAAVAIQCIDWSAAFDEEFDCRVLRTPGSDVEGGAIAGNSKVTVSLRVERDDIDPEIQEMANTVGISISGKLGQQSASFIYQFIDQRSFTLANCLDAFPIICRASANQLLNTVNVDVDATSVENSECVPAASSCSNRYC